jgi:membrane-bound serine protease (ClpP class)
VANGEVQLQTARAPVQERPMNLFESILMALADPNIAYILFSLGSIGLIAELYNPGSIFPGVTGAICLILSFTAFGSLPINWAGVLLLVIAMGLFAGEAAVPGIGFFAVGGIIAFLLGSLMLFTPMTPQMPGMPIMRVNPLLIIGTTLSIAAFFTVTMRAVMKTRRAPVTTGIEALIGQTGLALSALSPLAMGQVRLGSEVWSALSQEDIIAAHEMVQVVKVEGVTLYVTRSGAQAQRLM